MITCRSVLRRLAAFCVVPALSILVVSPVSAATIAVTSVADAIRAGDGCSLREALINANTDSRSGSFECEAGSGADRILLPPQRISLIASTTDDGAADSQAGDLDVEGTLEIVGGGEQLSSISGLARSRIFDVQPGASLTLRRLTLERGAAASQGGAIRVAGTGSLRLEDTVVLTAAVTAADATGGAIYLAPNATANILRSLLRQNTASAANGQGGGIYCDGCTLNLHAVTLAENKATQAGGGLYLRGGNTSLNFVTVYGNLATTSAGIHVGGTLRLLGVISADNGNGIAGDDLNCVSGTASAQYSFAEYPATSCSADGQPAGLMSRADAPFSGSANARLLKSSSLTGQPSTIYEWSSSTQRPAQTVPASYCVEPAGSSGRLRDQWSRRLVSGGDCATGAAHDRPRFGTSTPSLNASVGGSSVAVTLSISGTAATTSQVVLRDAEGSADACGFTPVTLTLAAGSNILSPVQVDPNRLFGGTPLLGRPERVCELMAEVTSGDPALLGTTTGLIRIKVKDERSTRDIATPGNNQLLNIGFVPISAGGSKTILFSAPGSGWSYTVAGDAISEDSTGRFSVPAGTQPIAQSPASTALPVTCRPDGVAGDYLASLALNVSDGASTWHYSYRLRCQVGHTLTLVRAGGASTTSAIAEDPLAEAGNAADLLVRLDSASTITEPFQVRVVALAGTASASDYLLTPADGLVTFRPGDREQSVRVTAVDDNAIEAVENLLLGVELPAGILVKAIDPSSVQIDIDSDDILYRTLALSPIAGLPVRTPAGERLQDITATLENVSHPDAPPFSGLTVTLSVDRPAWVESFVARRCLQPVGGSGGSCTAWTVSDCRLDPTNRLATCIYPGRFAVGDLLEISTIVRMADLVDAPTIEIGGTMKLAAKGNSDGVSAEDQVEQRYFIVGVRKDSAATFAVLPLLVIMLLAVRRGRHGRFVGGKVRRYANGGIPSAPV